MNISEQICHSRILFGCFQSQFIFFFYCIHCKCRFPCTCHYFTGACSIQFINLNLYIFLKFIINRSIYCADWKQSVLSYKYRQ